MIAAVSGYARRTCEMTSSPGLAGHLEVAHDQLERARRELPPRLEAVLGGRAHVTRPFEEPPDELAHVALVVDDQDARRCRSQTAVNALRRIGAFRSSPPAPFGGVASLRRVMRRAP